MLEDQDITHVRGDDLKIPFTITLDQSRTLNDAESWEWQLRLNVETDALITLTKGSGIATVANQPEVTLLAADFPVGATFPISSVDRVYFHELQMTKSGLVETVARGAFTLKSDGVR